MNTAIIHSYSIGTPVGTKRENSGLARDTLDIDQCGKRPVWRGGSRRADAVVPFGSGSLREPGGNRRGYGLGGKRIPNKARYEW